MRAQCWSTRLAYAGALPSMHQALALIPSHAKQNTITRKTQWSCAHEQLKMLLSRVPPATDNRGHSPGSSCPNDVAEWQNREGGLYCREQSMQSFHLVSQ